MKKQIKILMLVLMIILTSTLTLTVNAADAIVTLNLDNEQVHAGDTFVVTMNVACEEGINGLQGTVSYDQTKLELVSIAVADTTKWFNLGENLSLAVIHNSSDTETSADIVKVTLKVKDTAELGTANITISDIVVDSDATSNSMKQVGTKEVEVSIVEKQTTPDPDPQEKALTGIEITKTPTRTTYTAGEKFDKTGMVVTAKYSDGSTKVITDYTIDKTGALTVNDNKIVISYTENGVTKTVEQKITITANGTNTDKDGNTQKDENSNPKDEPKDTTKADKEIPKTGTYSIIGFITFVLLAAVVFYTKYNKYKQI